ncbi:universal stress protein [Streptomyces sp. NPDC057445]|uniref:universal stress protein n=1 Tax=Streptomyces sp. NPDC057445 TaxID=3346136 RepID=UPI00369D59DA
MGRIVVGVDGSDGSLEALGWAARQAQLTGDSLEAVTTWDYPATGWASMVPGMPTEFDPEKLARQIQEESLERVLGPDAAGAVTRTVLVGNAAQTLLDRAEGASLLVVGARGHSGFRAAMLGSVGIHVTHHAPCPVVVVRGTTGEE